MQQQNSVSPNLSHISLESDGVGHTSEPNQVTVATEGSLPGVATTRRRVVVSRANGPHWPAAEELEV
jgi:hypothetical protein